MVLRLSSSYFSSDVRLDSSHEYGGYRLRNGAIETRFPGLFLREDGPTRHRHYRKKVREVAMALKGDRTPKYFECCPQDGTILVRFGS